MQEVAAMPQSVVETTKDLVLKQIHIGILSPENLYDAIRRTFQSLMTLQSREESGSPAAETPPAPADWRTSITRQTITCLECGATLKQLNGHHLRIHGLNARTYRLKYGIPQNRPLMARATTARRKEIVRRTRPWEKSSTFIQAQERRAAQAAAKKSGRKKATRKG
jgi:predicted transcriptional regulator